MANIINRAPWIVFRNDAPAPSPALAPAGAAGAPECDPLAFAKRCKAGKPPKDQACVLFSVGTQEQALKKAMALSAKGESVSYTQLETGPWQVRIRRFGFPDQFKTFDAKKMAKEWATLREAEFHKREMTDYREGDRTTLGQLLLRYRDELRVDPLADNSLQHRLGKIARHKVAEYKMTALRPTHLAEYRNERLKVVKPATVVAELSYIASVIKHARTEWDIALPRNVATAEFVKRPKIGAEGERTRRLEKSEIGATEEERLFQALLRVRNPALRVFVILALETGVRRAELLRLKWCYVFLEQGYLALAKGTTKNGHARQAPLSPLAINALRSLPQTEELVFAGETRDSIKCGFARIREWAGLVDFRLHDLRHEFTSRLFEETTLREFEIQVFTGHRDSRMLERYTHLRPAFMNERLKQSRLEMTALRAVNGVSVAQVRPT